VAETVEAKAELFREAFFPTIPQADVSDIPNTAYPNQLSFPRIQPHEIVAAARAAPPDKAPGEDGIPNSVWHKVISVPKALEAMGEIFNACVEAGHNPAHFQRSITVVLRKPGEDRDYRMPKAYRPVALLNTLGKILESIIAKRLSYAIETYELLPPTHLGGRKGVSTDHAIQLVIERIREAWGRGLPVVSMLLLDVVGAYDNAHHDRLLHNLRRKRLGHYAPWIQAFLSERTTRIRMPEGMSERIPTTTGIPQGSPISPILYLIYNADLLSDCAEPTEGTTTSGWVDDVSFLTTGASEQANVRKLNRACGKADEWARKHASIFDTKKYKLVHFVNPRSSTEPHYTPITLPDGTVIDASREAERYLGFWLDPSLTFEAHRAKALAKAGTSLHALRGLSGSTWGVALSHIRRTYQAIVIPQMLFGVAAWFQPGALTKKEIGETVREFAAIQKRAAVLISGAFRSTAAAALDIELHLLPMKLQMEQLVKETALRIRTGPTHAMPTYLREQRSDEEIRLGGITPMEVHAWKKGGCLEAPPDALTGRWESREAFVRAPWHALPKVIIEEKEEATRLHNVMLHKLTDKPLMLYTDGSGFQGQIAASMVSLQAKKQRTECLGTEGTSTVYAGEARGLEFALQAALQYGDLPDWEAQVKQAGVVILSDSQAALKTLLNPRMVSGQVFIRACQSLLDECAEEGIPVTLQWIPAHIGIPGNEAADRAAKRAAQTAARQPETITNWPRRGIRANTNQQFWLAAAAKRRIRQSAKDAWKKEWERGKTAAPTRRLINAPTKKALRYWGGLRKATASVLIQLRTQRVALNHYLWRINRRDSPLCPCDLGGQTVRHIIMDCPQFIEDRDRMFEKIRGVKRAAGFDKIMTEKGAAVAVAQFILDIGILDQFRAVDPQATGDADQEKADAEAEAEANQPGH
jgi:ribonuclease HI